MDFTEMALRKGIERISVATLLVEQGVHDLDIMNTSSNLDTKST